MANMTKLQKIGLFCIFLIQILISGSFELAHDEAYYWLYSKNLAWGYFDHPPGVGVIIKLFSFLPHSEISVRLGFIFLQLGTLLLLIALTGVSLTTILLFFSFPLASFTGILALPDMPLLFMAALYCFVLKKYLEKDSLQRSLLLGLIISGVFYAKYHGVLLVFFTLLACPKLFLRRSFYIVALTALVSFFPHMYWQYQHEFSTLKYHFIERPSSSFSLKRTFEYVVLQTFLAGIFVAPVVWWIALKRKSTSSFDRAMKFMAIGTIVFFLISSFSKKVEANWTIFLAVPLIYLCADSDLWRKKWAKNLLLASFALVFSARTLFLISPEVVGIKRLKEFHGWKNWATEVEEKCEGRPLIANSYQIASKLSYYLEREINALNYHSRKNQFDYWRFDKDLPTKDVCYITDKKTFKGTPTVTPEGKTLQLIKNLGLDQLWELK
jgi:hypothetical protein